MIKSEVLQVKLKDFDLDPLEYKRYSFFLIWKNFQKKTLYDLGRLKSMEKGRILGLVFVFLSIVIAISYTWIMFSPPYVGLDILLLKLTVVIVVVGLSAILALVGINIATTPPPSSVNEIEKEIEEELKELEKKV